MLARIKRFLRKWPAFYEAVKNLWYGFRRILETYVFGTRIQEWIWRARHLYKGRDWAKDYLRSTDHPHRKQIIEAVWSFYPFETVLEVGCSSGPNLILLAQKFPDVHFIGIDINVSAIKTGKQYLRECNISNVSLFTGRADRLGRFKDKSVDIVFTDAVLMFVGKDKITGVLKEMGRIARKGLIFNEYNSPNLNFHKYDDGRWVYNFERVLRECFPSATLRFEKSTFTGGCWDEYGTLIKTIL